MLKLIVPTQDEIILAKAGKGRDCFKKTGNRLEAARKKLSSDIAKRNAQTRKEKDPDCFKKLRHSAATKKAMKELYQTNPKEYLRQLFEKHKED